MNSPRMIHHHTSRLVGIVAVLVASLLAAIPALAATQIVFSGDGSKATVLLLAVGTNPDAAQLYGVLNVPAQEVNGRTLKRVLFKDAAGTEAVDIVCVLSKVVPGVGSCTAILHAAKGLTQDPAHGVAVYQVAGEEAARLAAQFAARSPGGEIYRSSDGHFIIAAIRDSLMATKALRLSYH